MKVLITGANGVSGMAMENFLLSLPERPDLYLTGRGESGREKYYKVDLSRPDEVKNLINEVKPDRVYHFAGTYTNVLEQDFLANVLISSYILEQVKLCVPECKVLLIGSAAEYGFASDSENPVTENQPLRPVSMYGLSKVFQAQLMDFFCRVHDLNICMARTFNLLDNKLSDKLLVGKIYKQAALLKSGKIQKITLGDLSSRRDYIRTEEAVVWYHKIMEKGKKNEVYNVGRGEGIVVEELVENILKEEGLNHDVLEIKPIINSNKLNISSIYANISKIKKI